MIDKETIVNGIQVRECGHYRNGTCLAYTDNTGKYLLCINSPNCYYKQLAQLKEELQEYQDWFDEFKLMFRYDDREPDDNSELYSCLEHVFDENKKLKQTITEIKKIANYSFNLQTSAYMAKLELILEKINEVEK